MKRIFAFVFVTLICFSLCENSIIIDDKKLNVSETIILKPNVEQEIDNPLLFKVNVSCKVSSVDNSDIIHGEVKKGGAKIGGKDVGPEGLDLEVKNNDSFSIEAKGSTKAVLTNKGANDVTAVCSLSYSEEESYLNPDIIISNSINDEENDDLSFNLENMLLVGQKIVLKPNDAQEISNPLLWTISVSCQITTVDESDLIHAQILKGSATLNGEDIGTGKDISVKSSDKITITAKKSTKASLTNNGTSDVIADCSLSSESIEKINFVQNVLNTFYERNNIFGSNSTEDDIELDFSGDEFDLHYNNNDNEQEVESKQGYETKMYYEEQENIYSSPISSINYYIHEVNDYENSIEEEGFLRNLN